MIDLISRAAAVEYLMTNMGWHDEDGYDVDDADEKRAIITDLVNGIPAVDAVPVEWLVDKAKETNAQAEPHFAFMYVLHEWQNRKSIEELQAESEMRDWQKEQEAR